MPAAGRDERAGDEGEGGLSRGAVVEAAVAVAVPVHREPGDRLQHEARGAGGARHSLEDAASIRRLM